MAAWAMASLPFINFTSSMSRLFFGYTIYFDAGIGTDCGTRSASDAGFVVLHIGEVIPAIVHFFGLEHQHVGRAGNHAEAATFAAVGINDYSSMNFCHVSG